MPTLTQIQIAIPRAKCIARHSIGRAVELLIAIGVPLNDASRFLFAVLRRARVTP